MTPCVAPPAGGAAPRRGARRAEARAPAAGGAPAPRVARQGRAPKGRAGWAARVLRRLHSEARAARAARGARACAVAVLFSSAAAAARRALALFGGARRGAIGGLWQERGAQNSKTAGQAAAAGRAPHRGGSEGAGARRPRAARRKGRAARGRKTDVKGEGSSCGGPPPAPRGLSRSCRQGARRPGPPAGPRPAPLAWSATLALAFGGLSRSVLSRRGARALPRRAAAARRPGRRLRRYGPGPGAAV